VNSKSRWVKEKKIGNDQRKIITKSGEMKKRGEGEEKQAKGGGDISTNAAFRQRSPTSEIASRVLRLVGEWAKQLKKKKKGQSKPTPMRERS